MAKALRFRHKPAESKIARRLRGETRPIVNLPRSREKDGDDRLFVEPNDLTPNVQRMLDHNRERFAKHHNYADEHGAGEPTSYDSKGDYNCGRCNQLHDKDQCLLVEISRVDPKAGSCRQWESIRAGDPEMMLQREEPDAAAYGVAVNGKGFGCARCPYSKPAKNKDDLGRTHWCGLGGFHQTPTACCELNGAETLKGSQNATP